MAINIKLSGIDKICGSNNLGGIKNIFMCNYDDGKVKSLSTLSTLTGIIKVSRGETIINDFEGKKYETNPESSNFNTTSSKGGNNQFQYKSVITLSIGNLSWESYKEIRNLCTYGAQFTLFCEMNYIMTTYEQKNEPVMMLFGYDNPVLLSSFVLNSGSDINSGYNISMTFEVIEDHTPYQTYIKEKGKEV